MEITARPYQYCFSKNKIEYQFLVENPKEAGCRAEIKLYMGDEEVAPELAEPEYTISLVPNPIFSEYNDARLNIGYIRSNVNIIIRIKRLSDNAILDLADYDTLPNATPASVVAALKTVLDTHIGTEIEDVVLESESTIRITYNNELYLIEYDNFIITDVSPTETGLMIYSTILKPQSDGTCAINLQDIIDSYIQYQLPEGTAVVVATNLSKFYIQYRRITEIDTDTEFTSDEENMRTAIKGGIGKLFELLEENYFTKQYSNVLLQPFSTWQPDKRFIGKTDKIWITWMCILMGDSPAKGLRIRYYNFAGEETIVDKEIPNAGADILYHIPAGIQQLGIPADDLWYYTLRVEYLDGDDTEASAFSPLYTFYVDYRNFYGSRVFNYYNSLGGIDYVRILGETEENYSRDFSESEVFIGQLDESLPPSSFEHSNIRRADSFKSDVGYRHNPEEIEALKEILTSALIWEYYSDKRLRVILTNKSGTMKRSNSKRFSLPIEWRYGFIDPVYTPIKYLN
jgi:hypothetical protein